jgi:hypothetical protein
MILTSNRVERALSAIDDLDGGELLELRNVLRAREALRLEDGSPPRMPQPPPSERFVRPRESQERDRPSYDDLAGSFIAFRCGVRTVDSFSVATSDFEFQQQEYGLSCLDCIEGPKAELVLRSWRPNWSLAAQRARALMAKIAAGANDLRKEKSLGMVKAFLGAIDYCANPSRDRYCYVVLD